jgi:hypothetical protein
MQETLSKILCELPETIRTWARSAASHFLRGHGFALRRNQEYNIPLRAAEFTGGISTAKSASHLRHHIMVPAALLA